MNEVSVNLDNNPTKEVNTTIKEVVPAAFLAFNPKNNKKGNIIDPPPIPKRPVMKPTVNPKIKLIIILFRLETFNIPELSSTLFLVFITLKSIDNPNKNNVIPKINFNSFLSIKFTKYAPIGAVTTLETMIGNATSYSITFNR